MSAAGPLPSFSSPSFSPPSFSVVINTLNRANLLNDAITGVFQLDYPRLELVVVNGPSTDHTEQVLAAWEGRIKLRHCNVPNLSVSRNVGIAAAAGDIVAFLDDDAVPHPDWLNRLAPHYARPDVGAVGGFTIDHTGMRWQVRKTICDRYGNAHFVDDLFDLGPLNFARTPFYPSLLGTNSSFRRSALREIGGFDHTFAYLLDETDVCLRLVDDGWSVVYEPDALIFHQFAESHVRSPNHQPRTLYPSVVSKTYFIQRHGKLDGMTRQAEMLDTYREELLTANRWLAENGHISNAHHTSLDRDVMQGIETGARAALAAAACDKTAGDMPCAEPNAPFLPVKAGDRLRVALVSQGYPPENDAGIARWTSLVARGLADLGVQVHVVTRTAGLPARRFQHGIWLHQIAAESPHAASVATAYDVPEHDLARWMAAVSEELRFIKTFGLDLVSFPIWDLEALPTLDDPDLASVMSLHTTYRLARPFKPEWNLRVLFGRRVVDRVVAAEEQALRRAPFILANSQTIVSEIEQAYGLSLAGRHRVVPHGTPDLLAEAGLSLDARLAENAARAELQVLVPARFELRKGYDLALRLAREMNGGDRVQFHFAGADVDPATEAAALRDSGVKLRELQNVTFHGKLDRAGVDALYLSADVVVMPSRFESFGLVAIEAMSAGAPVIALSAGALGEVVEEGRSGWLLAEDSFVEGAARILRQLAADRPSVARLSHSAYAAFHESFSTAAMAQGILDYYRTAVAARREQA